MKTAKKALLLTVCALVLVAATIMGTMAYLTADDQVVNTFTVGKLAMKLDEAPVDQYGNVTNEAREARIQANTYKLIPGHHYTKDPTVWMQPNSEAAYLYVIVDNGLGHYVKSNKVGTPVYSLKEQMMQNHDWECVYGAKNGEMVSIYYKEVPATGAEEVPYTVFDSFDIIDNATNTQLEGLKDAKITVTAYAVQKDGFTGAVEAWNAAFKNVAEIPAA